MSKSLFFLLSLSTILQVGSVSAQYAKVAEDDVFKTRSERYGHLQYFGFYASAMGEWNFTAELAPFTNLTWIHVKPRASHASSARKIIERLEQAREAGVSATVSLRPFLFENDRGDPKAPGEINDFLMELRWQIEAGELMDTVVMFYPKGEPFRDFKNARNPDFTSEYLTGEVYEEIHADLTYVNDQVKQVFPDKPLGVVLSGYDIFHDFFSIPDNYDWVGFDCYSNLFSGCEDRSFVAYYSRLLEHMQPHQRLIAVPETWVSNANLDRDDWPNLLLKRFRHHYEMALNEPRFIAFIPFLWSFDTAGEPVGNGLNRFPEHFDNDNSQAGARFQNQVKKIGRQVKHGRWKYPNLAYEDTEPHRDRPRHRIRGEIMSVNRNGLISAWAVDEALAHKNLKVRIRLRDTSGDVVYRTKAIRTFIRDPGLAGKSRADRRLIGNHGFAHRIPRKIREQFHGQVVQVEFVSYGDGGKQIGDIDRLEFIMGSDSD